MVAIYARQSVDRPDSISIEMQIQKCREHLKIGEIDHCRTYEDRGFSGKNVNRPGLQSLLRNIEEGRIDKVVAYKIDRISRSVHDFTGLCDLLTKKKVAFQSCEDGVTLDDSPTGTALAQMMMVFAQLERETILRRVTDNYYERAKLGMYLGGRPPFGFDKGETSVAGKKTAYFTPNYMQAEIVIELYDRYLEERASLGTLMRWLNDERRVPTNTGGSWSTVQMGRLIRNPAYVQADAAVYRYLKQKGATMTNPIEDFNGSRGCYLYANRAPKEKDGIMQNRSKFSDVSDAYVSLAPHDGLIDAETWLKAQHKMDQNKMLKNSGAGSHSWLSGLMKCAQCGYAVTVVNKSSGMRGHYINCGGHKKGNSVCTGRTKVMTLEQIEDAVEAQLLPYLESYTQVAIQKKSRHQVGVNQLEMRIVLLEEEIARLTRNLAMIDLPDVVKLTAEAIHTKNAEVAKLRVKQDGLRFENSGEDLQALFLSVLNEWKDYGIAEKKQIARIVIDRVMVGDGSIEIVFTAGYGDA